MDNNWKPINTAPRDGTEILARRHNGVSFEHYIVWWNNDDFVYPWKADGNSYSVDRMDDWALIPGDGP